MRTIEEYITLKEQEAEKLRGEMKELSVLIDAFFRAVSEDRKESRIAAEAEAKKNAQWRYNNYRRLARQQWGQDPDEVK